MPPFIDTTPQKAYKRSRSGACSVAIRSCAPGGRHDQRMDTAGIRSARSCNRRLGGARRVYVGRPDGHADRDERPPDGGDRRASDARNGRARHGGEGRLRDGGEGRLHDEKPEGQYGGTLAYWIRSDPPGWDPWGRTRFWDPTRKIAELVFNPLYSPAAQLGDSCEIDLDPRSRRAGSTSSPPSWSSSSVRASSGTTRPR